MSTKPTFRDLFKMGYFSNENTPAPQKTRSGRVSNAPKRFSQEQFTKGSGCCNIPKRDYTDMNFNGSA